jgi:ABC-type transporter Mla subunit MlaD
VSGFIEHAGTTASATASEGAALEASLRLLPPFLRQLKPTADQLGATADQLTPALADLHSEAPTISRVVEGLGPFATAATPALETLGDAADVGRRALTRSEPLIRDLSTLGRELGPLSTNLAGLLTSFRDAGGVERLLDTIFYQASTTNGYDALGHYLRAGLIVNTCSSYSAEPAPGCSAKFEPGATAAAANYLLGPRGGR